MRSSGSSKAGPMQHSGGAMAQFRTGMVDAVLREIAELLEKLAVSGEPGFIDLRSMPMTDADRAELEERLGRGEVEASLDVAGTSEVRETGYAGVWWIRHAGAGGKVAAEEIAVAEVPEILKAHHADIAAAASRLNRDLAENMPNALKEDAGDA